MRRHKRLHRRLGFKGLERKVEKEYERKGYSKAESQRWAQGTAANVYRRKQKRGF